MVGALVLGGFFFLTRQVSALSVCQSDICSLTRSSFLSHFLPAHFFRLVPTTTTPCQHPANTHVRKSDVESVQKSIVHHVTTTLARAAYNMDNFSAYQAVALR